MSKPDLRYLQALQEQRFRITRRSLLQTLGLVGVAPALTHCGSSDGGPNNGDGGIPPTDVVVSFQHGVASGDPHDDSVVLWTRVTPETEGPVAVSWRIARDEAMTDLVSADTFLTNADRDYTVKVEAGGLEPFTQYWYQFQVSDVVSPVGRTKTAPAGDASLDQVRFAFTSCALYAMGYFNAYRGLANRDDIDVVFALGDYIYEYGGSDPLAIPFALGRAMLPDHEIVTLEDYRTRHAQYKTDADLQAAHAAHPWICTWDDHETTNNSHTTGADNHTEGEEGTWTQRKHDAIQAYFEWLPVREAVNPNRHPDQHLYRNIRYGDLVEFFVLDTRLEGRDPQPADAEEAADPARHMISPTQEAWLLDGLRTTPAKWKILAQQTMISQLNIAPGSPFSLDPWDGYVAQRNRLFDAFASDDIDNVIVITGDIHTAFCTELTKDPDDRDAYTPGERGSVGVEFVCPSITTQGFPPAVINLLQPFNRHIRYAEGALDTGHGYVVVTATPQTCDAAWMYALSVLTPLQAERPGPVWGVDDGDPHARLRSLF